jgi:hypothetical protein
MDNFKFELIRANKAQEIMYCMNTKFQAATVQGLVDAFLEFAAGCGYKKEDLKTAFELHQDD